MGAITSVRRSDSDTLLGTTRPVDCDRYHITSMEAAMSFRKVLLSTSASAFFAVLAGQAIADCSDVPSWADLKKALTDVVAAGGNGGLGFNMWGTLVAV